MACVLCTILQEKKCIVMFFLHVSLLFPIDLPNNLFFFILHADYFLLLLNFFLGSLYLN